MIDVIINVDDSFLENLNISKAGMHLVDEEKANKVLDLIKDLDQKVTPGGSSANITHACGFFGAKSVFLGSVGDDSYGKLFGEGMTSKNVFPNLITQENGNTGFAITFITPDGERTFVVNLGVAEKILESELESLVEEKPEFIILEGFQVEAESLRNLYFGFDENQTVVLDVSDTGVITRMGESLEYFIEEQVDICFLNEDEFNAVNDKSVLDSCDLVIIKLGSKGCKIIDNKNSLEVEVPGNKVEVVNTNGAGDAFAGAFLANLLDGKSLKECGVAANNAGAKVVQQEAARIE